MKKTKTFLAALLITALTGAGITSCGTTGTDLGAILGTIGSGGTIGNVITSVIGLDKISAQNLIGTWNYNGPGCAFTSENLLAKAGGEIAATKAEQELKPYYDKLGLTAANTRVTFNQNGTFTATVAGRSFSGNYTFDETTAKITMQGLLLSFNCYVKREISGISLLFESKKLLTLLQTMATLSGNDTAQTISNISKNYDGIRLGFDMTR
jgi:hypothetical protein